MEADDIVAAGALHEKLMQAIQLSWDSAALKKVRATRVRAWLSET